MARELNVICLIVLLVVLLLLFLLLAPSREYQHSVQRNSVSRANIKNSITNPFSMDISIT